MLWLLTTALKQADSAGAASWMPDFALTQRLRFHCGFWKSTWASPHRGRWRDNHTPTQGCKPRSVGPNITITLALVSAQTLLCFQWICNVESKVFRGHGQWNLGPALLYPLWIYSEWFSAGWALIEHIGAITWYLSGVTRQNNISIVLHNSTKEHMSGFPYFIQFPTHHKYIIAGHFFKVHHKTAVIVLYYSQCRMRMTP